MLCSYGCNQEAIVQLKNGNWCCSDSVNKCPENRKKNSKGTKLAYVGKQPWYKLIGVDSPRKGIPSWNSGLSSDTNESLKKLSTSLIDHYLLRNGTFTGKHHSIESKNRMRIKKLEFYKNGGQVKCGRAKKIKYSSIIAGDILVDGNWELVVSKFFDMKKYHWKRNTERFEYINLKGKESTYCPDFWVDEFSSYIEVKGYKTDLDICKWNQFNKPLIIWDYCKLLEMKLIDKLGNPLL